MLIPALVVAVYLLISADQPRPGDPQPDGILYQGLAWEKLDKPEKALVIFSRLVNYGKEHLNDEVKIDFFAVSLAGIEQMIAALNKETNSIMKY